MAPAPSLFLDHAHYLYWRTVERVIAESLGCHTKPSETQAPEPEKCIYA
jgi:hypothetical protein